jgi:hypothetical protein
VPGTPKEVHVRVFVHPGSPNGDYHFETTDLPMGPQNHLYFENCGHPGLYVYYDIQPGTNYVFPDQNLTPRWKNEVLWATQQPSCPMAEPNAPLTIFQPSDVQNSGTTLVVRNTNPKKEDFWYTLRVTNDRGANYLPLDPGGTNDNGSTSFTFSGIGIAVIGGAIAGSLLTLAFQMITGS